MSEAHIHLDAGINVAEQTGECWFEPELHRLKGELLLRQCPDEEAQAEAAFRLAIERAAGADALFWELRASVSLAKLLVVRDRPGQARDALAPVYHRFTEGLDWPDLREAEIVACQPCSLNSPGQEDLHPGTGTLDHDVRRRREGAIAGTLTAH